VERKIAAYVQDRIGPNRVGPWGLLQPIADGLKFILKEDVVPTNVNKLLYIVAPAVAVSTALLAIVVVPFGATTPPPQAAWPHTQSQAEVIHPQLKAELDEYNKGEVLQDGQVIPPHYQFVIAPHVDVGLVLIFAITSLAVYGIILGGWASNSKYSFLGAVRASAQMVSYEIPLGMAAITVVLLTGTLNLERIIQYQADTGVWLIAYQPLAFLILLTSAFAECNRLPFDLSECEQELVGGFHTEYSSMKFAMFFLGEYTHMITTSFLVSILFLGGWHFIGISETSSPFWVKLLVLAAKMLGFILFFMMIRWTIPRFRFDQLMGLAWKVFIPLTVVNLVAVMVVKHLGLSEWWLLPISVALFIGAAALTLPKPHQKPTSKYYEFRRRMEATASR
jgi:NADH-quinone oxidoreductase subunit H